MKHFIISLFLAAAPAYATDPLPLLDLRNTSGMGLLTKELTIYNDGSVMCSQIMDSTGQLAKPVKIAALDADQIGGVETSIAAISQSPLVRLDPTQRFNPGGFTSTYLLVRADGQSFAFAKSVSGVDYGFANKQGQELVALLQNLSQLKCGR